METAMCTETEDEALEELLKALEGLERSDKMLREILERMPETKPPD